MSKALFEPRGSGTGSRSTTEAKRFRYIAGGIVMAFAAVIAFLALRQSPYLQYVPWMPRRLGTWADNNGIVRNTVAFFGLGTVVFALLGPRLVWLVALCLFGTAIEVAQIWIPSRSFDWKDIVATIAGILPAWAIVWSIRRWAGVR